VTEPITLTVAFQPDAYETVHHAAQWQETDVDDVVNKACQIYRAMELLEPGQAIARTDDHTIAVWAARPDRHVNLIGLLAVLAIQFAFGLLAGWLIWGRPW